VVLSELPLLTLGAQLYGKNNNEIGKQAVLSVFASIGEIVRDHELEHNEREIVIRNASSRKVVIRVGTDPDITVIEDFKDEARHKVAIEIKGGSDRSNAHNRAGEAEKSHQ
jgi:hypothetical protein